MVVKDNDAIALIGGASDFCFICRGNIFCALQHYGMLPWSKVYSSKNGPLCVSSTIQKRGEIRLISGTGDHLEEQLVFRDGLLCKGDHLLLDKLALFLIKKSR